MKRITLLLPLCIGCLSGFAQLRPYTLAHESQASINSDNSATRRPQVASTPLFSAAKTLAGAENGYGVAFDLGYVRFPLATPRNRVTVRAFTEPMVIAGAEMPDGKTLAFTYILNSSGAVQMQKMASIDPATGNLTDVATLPEDFPTVLDATYEPVSKSLLALAAWSTDTRPWLIRIDPATAALTRLRHLSDVWYSLAADGQGRLFLVRQQDGALGVLFNPLSGQEPVPVGRGTAAGAAYISSLAFDRDAYRLYWAMCGSDGRAHLLDINVLNGAASEVGTIGTAGASKELMAFTIPAVVKPQDVPAAPTDLHVVPAADGALTATATYKTVLADSTFVYLNGTRIQAYGATAGGTDGRLSLTGLQQGYNHLRVVGSNAAGQGHYADAYFFAGRDVPCSVTDLKVTRVAPDSARISWTAPTQSVHGGYVSPTNIKYRITRYSLSGDTAILQKTFRGTLYNDHVPAGNTYYYTVQALSTDYGETAASDTLYLGPALGLPYDCRFATRADYTPWTARTRNGNPRPWVYYSSSPQHIYNPPYSQGNDDWIFSAPFKLEQGKEYYLYILAKSGLGTYYPKMLEVSVGNQASPESQTQVLRRDTIASRVNEELRYTFTVPASGEYSIALHDLSPFVSCNLYVYQVRLDEKTQGIVSGRVTDANGQPVAGAEVSIDRTTLVAVTGADGSYAIDYVEPGTYSMAVAKPGYSSVSTQHPVDVASRQNTNVNFTMPALPSATLSGTIADNYAKPIEGATVRISAEGLGYEALTDARGAYTITGIPVGQYAVRVEKLRFIPWNSTADLTADASVSTRLDPLPLAPHNITASQEDGGVVTVTWERPRAMFRRDNGVPKSQNGAVVGNEYYVFGHVYRQPAVVSAITWMTTDYRGPHNEMNLWIFGVNADGTPSRQVLYNAMHVPAAGDLQWSRHELPQPVTCPDGFYLAVSYSEGMASIAMSDGEDPVWPFEEGVNFRNKDYRTDDWACVDASFVRNTYMLRAEGEAIGDKAHDYGYNYELWRLPAGTENDTTRWQSLTTLASELPTSTVVDNLAGIADGDYRYALACLYPGNILSEKVFSPVYHLTNDVDGISIDGLAPWPNPVVSELHLGLKCDRVELYDLTGTLRLNTADTDRLDMSALPAGCYLLRAVSGNQHYVTKIIKK